MIVVDTNVIASLYLSTQQTAAAEALLRLDPEWAAPLLWRSELRNVLALYLRKELLTFSVALEIQQDAEALLQGREYRSNSLDVLTLVRDTPCSAYDCEFVALAQALKTRLITLDQKMLRHFPATAIDLPTAVEGRPRGGRR